MTTLVRSVYFECRGEAGGQTYRLDAYVRGSLQAATGMVINLKDLDRILHEVLAPYSGRALPAELSRSEDLLRRLFSDLRQRLSPMDVQLVKTRLIESDDLWFDEVEPS